MSYEGVRRGALAIPSRIPSLLITGGNQRKVITSLQFDGGIYPGGGKMEEHVQQRSRLYLTSLLQYVDHLVRCLSN
jgi:hypothetical protein